MDRPARMTVHELLSEARTGLRRVGATELAETICVPASGSGDEAPPMRIIDTRSRDNRAATGVIEGSEHIELSVLLWRIDPDSGFSEGTAAGFDERLVIVCADGYSSSLAAATLQKMGFGAATDLIGGMSGWIAQGLPVVPAPESIADP